MNSLLLHSAALAVVIALVSACGARASSISSERPRVLLDAKEIVRLRTEIRTKEWKRSIYERPSESEALWLRGGPRTNAERWLSRQIEIPARGGHYHHFFCADGARLTFPDDLQPRREGYACSACGKVYQGEKYDAAVRRELHSALSQAAFDLALTSQIEQDRRYAEKAAEILRKYAAAYPGPHTTNLEGGILLQSLCEAVWSIPLAWAYDLIHDAGVLSEQECAKIENEFFRPMARGLAGVGTHGNWGSWHLSAVGVTGYAVGDEELVAWAIKNFKAQIAEQLGEDGLWPESVHTYHFYPLGAFLDLAEAARHSGEDLYAFQSGPGRSLKAMFTQPLRYMYPNFQLPAINDGWFKQVLPLNQYELAFARYGEPQLGWALHDGYAALGAKRDGLWALLQGADLPESPEPPPLASIDFPVLGIVILRSAGGAMMTFDYGPFLGHGQLDKMAVTLFGLGRIWAADYGTPGYGSPILPWYAGTAGHNTVVVDGKNQARTNERRLALFATGKEFEVAQAETMEAYSGVLHRRSIVRIGEKFVLIDHLESSEERRYDWFFRSEGELILGPMGEEAEESELGYEHVKDAIAVGAAGAWAGRWSQGEQSLYVRGFSSAPLTLYSAKCPSETANRMVPLVVARANSKTLDIVTVLVPRAAGERVDCTLEDGVLAISEGEAVDYLAIGTRAAEEGMASDGAFALVRTSDGSRPVRAGVVSGASLRWNGKSLIDVQPARTSVEVEIP